MTFSLFCFIIVFVLMCLYAYFAHKFYHDGRYYNDINISALIGMFICLVCVALFVNFINL